MRSLFSLTPWVRRLLVANAVVFLLEITVFTGPWLFLHFGFVPSLAVQQPWTFATYMFLHGDFWHLAFNMLMLFVFGPAVEERIGSAAFAVYFLICGLGGSVLSLAMPLFTTVGVVIGASAAVLGVAMAFAVFWPNAPIYIFPLPVPIKAKWLVMFLVAVNLLFIRAPDGVARFAHVGGFLFGFIWLYVKGYTPFVERLIAAPRRKTKPRVLVHPSASDAAATQKRPKRKPRRKSDGYKEVDRVLDKISQSGIDSLTPEERRFLDEMSQQLRKH